MDHAFNVVKAAIFIGEELLVYRRDDVAGLIWRNMWDFPGGGREGAEAPDETLARELDEEFGLDLADAEILWRRIYPARHDLAAFVWFMVARLPAGHDRLIRFGEEGQEWRMMAVGEFLALPDSVPHLGPQLRDWIASGSDASPAAS